MEIKKNEILPFATIWMELESITLSEISQSEKDKYHDFTRVEFKKQNKQREKGKKRERKANHKKLLTIGNKLRAAGREVGGRNGVTG